MANSFTDFLNRNSVKPSKTLPLVHSTPAYFIKHILNSGQSGAIVPQRCDVFGNDLSYFFFARPAYKLHGDDGEAAEWELPACFIFAYDMIPKPKRVYPFDSGAFHRGRMPHYIGMMKRDEFEVSNVADAPTRIVGAFFSDVRSYFKGKAKDTSQFQTEFTPGVFDAEIKAIHRLALADSSAKLDDRKLSVEVQVESTIDLAVSSPIAVVAPLPYYDDQAFRDHVIKVWKAQLISYPVSSLSLSAYYALIYEVFDEVMKYREKDGSESALMADWLGRADRRMGCWAKVAAKFLRDHPTGFLEVRQAIRNWLSEQPDRAEVWELSALLNNSDPARG